MKTLILLLLILPSAASTPSASASPGAPDAPEAPGARQDVEGKKNKKKQRKQRKATEGSGAQGAGDEPATRKRKPRKPPEVVEVGAVRKAKREAQGLEPTGRDAGAQPRNKEQQLTPPTEALTVTRGEDAAAARVATPREGKDANEARDPAPGEPQPLQAAPRAARRDSDRPASLATELRTHWSRLARLDELSGIFLESRSMEAYQRADRLRSIENKRFHTAMAALRKRLGAAQVDGALGRLQSRGGKWRRSDWLRGDGKPLE